MTSVYGLGPNEDPKTRIFGSTPVPPRTSGSISPLSTEGPHPVTSLSV